MTKLNRKLKISLWIIGSLIVAGALAFFMIFTFSTRATSDFRQQATQQLNAAIKGEATDATAELKRIWLAEPLNSDYKKVANLQTDYKNLLTNVKNYKAISKVHDALVENYNNGIRGNAPLSGDLLKSVDQYLAAVKNRFPDQTDRITALENLSTKVASNTDFDAVSTDIEQLLSGNDIWLSEQSETINQAISDFQDKVNK